MTIKTLNELNKEFMSEESVADRPAENRELRQETAVRSKAKRLTQEKPQKETPQKETPQKEKRSARTIVLYILLYLAIMAVLLSTLAASRYSFYTVKTSSMQDEIPKGSLILVERTEPQELEVGDSITFMRDWRTAVTHKITDIYENHRNPGARGFQTKGTNNASQDPEIVHEDHVVGKVIFAIPGIGAALSWVTDNIYIVLATLGLLIILPVTVFSLHRRKQSSEAIEEIAVRVQGTEL